MEDSSITYEQLNDLSAEFDDAETELSMLPNFPSEQNSIDRIVSFLVP